MNPLTFKKAILATGVDGVLVIANGPTVHLNEIPKKIFVPIGECVFYTRKIHYLNLVLEKCKKAGMLELHSLLDHPFPFIYNCFFDENSGLIVNIHQLVSDFEKPVYFTENAPVYIELIDPIDYLNSWDMDQNDKNKWILAMLDKNPPEETKNKLLMAGCFAKK